MEKTAIVSHLSCDTNDVVGEFNDVKVVTWNEKISSIQLTLQEVEKINFSTQQKKGFSNNNWKRVHLLIGDDGNSQLNSENFLFFFIPSQNYIEWCVLIKVFDFSIEKLLTADPLRSVHRPRHEVDFLI